MAEELQEWDAPRLRALVGLGVSEALWDGESLYLVCGELCVEHQDCLALPEMGRECARTSGKVRTIYMLAPEGDCCARAYVQGVSIAYALKDAKVTAVEDIETTERPTMGSSDNVVDCWGHRIHTTKGTCTIDCRTVHNGYYSGHMVISQVTEVPKNAKPLDDFS